MPRAGIGRTIPTRVGRTTPLTNTRCAARTIPTRVGRTEGLPERRPNADHPHACGENALSRRLPTCGGGPSPRVWGKQRRRHPRGGQIADHPHACGENKIGARRHRGNADHPHACGRARLWKSPPGNKVGPSPRVWGERPRGTAHPQQVGPSPRVWGELRGTPSAKDIVRTIPTRVARTRTARLRHSTPRTIPTRVEKRNSNWWRLGRRTIPTRVGRTHRY